MSLFQSCVSRTPAESDWRSWHAHVVLCYAAEAFERIEGLLLHSIASPLEAPRLCAVQWARTLYPFDSPAARWICVLAAGDVKLEVREAGAKGLQAPSAPSSGGGGAAGACWWWWSLGCRRTRALACRACGAEREEGPGFNMMLLF